MLSAHLVRGPSSGWAGFPPSSSRRRALGSAAGPVPEFLYPPLQARGWRHSRLADDPKIHLRSGSCSSWNSGLLSTPVLSTCKSGSTSSLNSQMAPSPAASVLPCRAARLCSPPKPPPSPISSAVTESQNPFLLSCYQHHVSPAGRDGPRRAPPAPVLSDAYGLVSAQHEVLLSHRLDPPPPLPKPRSPVCIRVLSSPWEGLHALLPTISPHRHRDPWPPCILPPRDHRLPPGVSSHPAS